MTFGNLDKLEEKQPRGWTRLIPAALLAAFVLTTVGMNVWLWLGVDLGTAAAFPKVETEPAFPEPQVLHSSALSLPLGPFAAPWQAGRYEIDRVLPVELTVFYRGREPGDEARATLYVESSRDRWRLLAPLPAAGLLNGDFSAPRLLATLRSGAHPPLFSRLLPWRLWRWIGLRELQRRTIAEDGGGEPFRLWSLTRGRATVVGREYERGKRPGRRVAATCFSDGGVRDMRFVFTRVSDDNGALIRAWVDGLTQPFARKPDNQAGLAACESLPAAAPNEPAIRLCRQLHLLAAWHAQNRDPNVAAQLADLYAFAKDATGLRALSEQLAFEPDAPRLRAVRERVDKLLETLTREDAAAAKDKD